MRTFELGSKLRSVHNMMQVLRQVTLRCIRPHYVAFYSACSQYQCNIYMIPPNPNTTLPTYIEWQNELLSNLKLRMYSLFKCEYAPVSYINVVTCRAHRSFLAKLRRGSAPLEIETGRYVGTLPDLKSMAALQD